MTHPCCSDCRVRFAHAVSACPQCGEAVELLPASGILGYSLEFADPEHALPNAIAAAMALPRPGDGPS